jgi:hypothetical protein
MLWKFGLMSIAHFMRVRFIVHNTHFVRVLLIVNRCINHNTLKYESSVYRPYYTFCESSVHRLLVLYIFHAVILYNPPVSGKDVYSVITQPIISNRRAGLRFSIRNCHGLGSIRIWRVTTGGYRMLVTFEFRSVLPGNWNII